MKIGTSVGELIMFTNHMNGVGSNLLRWDYLVVVGDSCLNRDYFYRMIQVMKDELHLNVFCCKESFCTLLYPLCVIVDEH